MEEKFVKIDGYKIRYLESGTSNRTLVLLHGLGASAERWEYVIPLLNKNHNVIALDLIGFGHSDKPSVDYTTEFFSKFLFDFLNHLGIEKTNIVGSSLGGQIAAECAASYKDTIGKLVLVSPSGMMKQSTPSLDAYIMAALYPTTENAKTAYALMTGSTQKDVSHIIDDFIKRMSLPNAKMAFMSTILGLKNSNVITKLLKISIPTLIIWGELDPVIPIKYADTFVSSIRDCRFYEMKGCGHTPYVEKPNKFSEIVLDFIGFKR